jgi:SAM-dependent methyltransferase
MTEPTHLSVHYGKKAIPLRLVRRIARPQQRRLYEAFANAFPPRPDRAVLDLGVNGSLERCEQYFFEHHYPYQSRVTGCGLESGDHFRRCFPEATYVQTRRGESLPFEDGAFDVVFCNAVIEHVGSRAVQAAFMREILRVGRAAFVTTPNRWYPVELHTVLPLVHWLPTSW